MVLYAKQKVLACTRSTRNSPLFCSSLQLGTTKPRFSKPLQRQPGTLCTAAKGRCACHMNQRDCTCLTYSQQGRVGFHSCCNQSMCGIWAGFALEIPVPFWQEGLMASRTRCPAHRLPCKDLSPASGLQGPFFIQLLP